MAELTPQTPRPWQVLLVEDEPSVLQMLKGMLEHDGLAVTAASTGEDAMVRMREAAFDLLVTDKNLPGPDGIELARLARDQNPRMGIVLMTGYASLESAQEVLGVVDEYFTKPFDLRTFRGALKAVLERRARLASPPPRRHHNTSNVLLVSPDEGQRQRLTGLLSRLGIGVREAAVGDLEKEAAQPSPGALVIDTSVCGTDAVRAVWRRKAGEGDFPVVAISRNATIDGSTRAISLMARAHVLASDSDERLLEVLRYGLLGDRTPVPVGAVN
jgi:DNA-binding NtrC family response regulator